MAPRYDTVSSFFSEQFGRSFKLFGDTFGHDSTELAPFSQRSQM